MWPVKGSGTYSSVIWKTPPTSVGETWLSLPLSASAVWSPDTLKLTPLRSQRGSGTVHQNHVSDYLPWFLPMENPHVSLEKNAFVYYQHSQKCLIQKEFNSGPSSHVILLVCHPCGLPALPLCSPNCQRHFYTEKIASGSLQNESIWKEYELHCCLKCALTFRCVI